MKKTLTNQKAITQIQINKIDKLLKQFKGSSEHTKWIIDTQDILLDIFGKGSLIYQNFIATSWSPSGSFVTDMFTYEQKLIELNKQSYLFGLERSDGILKSGISQIRRKGVKNVFQRTSSTESSNDIVKILSLIDNKLRKVIRLQPENEKEVQNKIEDLFFGANLDQEFSREKDTRIFIKKLYPRFYF